MILKDMAVFTNDGQFLRTGAVVVRDGNIVSVSESPPDPSEEEDVLSFPGCVAIPGLVNAHSHIYSTLSRGMPLSGFSPHSFTEILEQLWWKLDRKLELEDIEISAFVAGIESLKSGITTLIDHHSSPGRIRGSLNTSASAVNSLGMRCATCYEISDRDGKRARDEAVDENAAMLSKRDEYCRGMLGLHASFTLSDETLKMLRDLDTDESPVHVHVAEGPEDQEKCISLHGSRIIQRFDRWGLLRRNSVLAHCIHIDQDEAMLIRRNGAVIAVNPQSNMNNGVGFTRWQELLEQGTRVALGNDGFGFNLTNDIRPMILLPHLLRRDVNVTSPADLQNTFFKTNFDLATELFGVSIGKIKQGYRADIAILEYNSPTEINSSNFIQHFFFGIIDRLSVREVFVSGEHVLHEGEPTRIDQQDVYKTAREFSSKLWSRVQGGA